MRARYAAILLLLAFWGAWRQLWPRVNGEAASLLLLLLLGLGAVHLLRGPDGDRQVPPSALIAAMLGYSLSALVGPTLLQIGVAATAMALIACIALGPRTPRLPLVGLTLLALPVLPTLDFLLAWPLRRLSALLTAALLQAQGLPVSTQGVALEFRGELLLFDAPCSGVRMLWAAFLLASLVAVTERAGPWRYLRVLAFSAALAIAANVLRAASLFHLEHSGTSLRSGALLHEAVGTLSFVLLAAAIVPLLLRRPGPAEMTT